MKNVTIWLRYKIYNLSAKRPKYIDMKNIYIYKSLLFNMIFFLDINICIKKEERMLHQVNETLWTHIFHVCSHSMMRLAFIWWKIDIFFQKILGVATYFTFLLLLFFNLFFKEKQNKKENHVWLFIWKKHVCKNQIWIWESSYLL